MTVRPNTSEQYQRRLGLPILCAVLWLGILVSSLGVVYSTFEARQATQELEELRRQVANLQVESGKYLLEKSALATYTRVESEAETQLGMQVPAVESLIMVHR